MDNSVLIIMIIGLVISSIIGALVLMLLGRFVGKISTVSYKNSFVICLISTLLIYLVWYLLGDEGILNMVNDYGYFVLIALNTFLISCFYIVVSKLVWKSSWIQSIKSNAVWIIVYAGYIGYAMYKILESL